MSLGSCSCHLQLIQTTALVWERMLTHAAHITQAWRMSQSGASWRRCLPGLRSGPRPRVLISSPRTRPWSETLASSIQSSGDKRQTESFYAHDNNLIFRKANIISLRASMTSSCTLSGQCDMSHKRSLQQHNSWCLNALDPLYIIEGPGPAALQGWDKPLSPGPTWTSDTKLYLRKCPGYWIRYQRWAALGTKLDWGQASLYTKLELTAKQADLGT